MSLSCAPLTLGRSLQTRGHHRLRHRLGQPQRRRRLQHLPWRGQAALLPGPRHRPRVPRALRVRRLPRPVYPAAPGEREAQTRREGLPGGGAGRAAEGDAW